MSACYARQKFSEVFGFVGGLLRAQTALMGISAFLYVAVLVSGGSFGLLSNGNAGLSKWLLGRLHIVAVYTMHISSVNLFSLSHFGLQ